MHNLIIVLTFVIGNKANNFAQTDNKMNQDIKNNINHQMMKAGKMI